MCWRRAEPSDYRPSSCKAATIGRDQRRLQVQARPMQRGFTAERPVCDHRLARRLVIVGFNFCFRLPPDVRVIGPFGGRLLDAGLVIGHLIIAD